MRLAQFQEARIADMVAEAEVSPPKWQRCERCHGRGGVPETTTLDGAPTGELYICPVCLGLGKVPTE